MSAINLAIVDDHKLFISGLRSLIQHFPDFNILFEAHNGTELVRKLQSKCKPQLILLDLSMPVMNGFETAEWLIANYPQIKIVVLSMLENEEKALKLIKSGIQGYLLKDVEPEEFRAALNIVASGGFFYSDFITRCLVKQLHHPGDKSAFQARLNTRELEFLRLTGTELTYKEIADRLCVSARTVDGYRDHLFEKLQVKSRVGLVMYAIKNNLISI